MKVAKAWAIEYQGLKYGWGQDLDRREIVTLGKVADAYHEKMSKRISPGYLEQITIAIASKGQILDFFKSLTRIQEITAGRIMDYVEHLREIGLSGVTINKRLSVLSGILKHAALYGWIDQVPYIQRAQEERAKVGRRIPPDDLERIMTAAESVSMSALLFVVLGRYSGLRRGEILALQWDDIDFKAGVIRLREQKNRTDMPAPLFESREYLERVPPEERKGHVITWQGKPVKNYRRTWASVMALAGVDYDTHDLRRSFISALEESQKYSNTEIAVLARHKETQTQERYKHADLFDAMGKWGDQAERPRLIVNNS